MDLDKILNSYQSFVSQKKPEDVIREKDSTLGAVANVSAFAGLMDDIRASYNMVADATTGRYNGLSKGTVALVVGGLAYLALPLDIVPDFIPVAGWLDDAAVLAWIFRQSAAELARYRAWRTDIACDGQ